MRNAIITRHRSNYSHDSVSSDNLDAEKLFALYEWAEFKRSNTRILYDLTSDLV